MKKTSTTPTAADAIAIAAASNNRRYQELKFRHPDAVILFREEDAYEMRQKDAEDANALLGLPVRRDADGSKVVTFPSSELDVYLPKLVRAGRRVAICEQLEDPRTTALVKKGVRADKQD